MKTNKDMHGATIAQWIKGWRSDIAMIDIEGYTLRHKAAIRVHAYNWLTSPSRLMSDREHSACHRLAKRVWKQLNACPLVGLWHESDSGRIWI
ncbi:hypothetical protein KAU11_09580 [Candidatus Babeliales bacterium]|nr:hypothetical protein [Candidatus Babeliales bacterium]